MALNTVKSSLKNTSQQTLTPLKNTGTVEKEEDYETTAPYSLKNLKDAKVYTKPSTYSISRTLLEVYKTDEENWQPYIPNSGTSPEEETSNTDEEETEEEEEETEEEENNEGFQLHQGEILETYYYGRFTELSIENDYEDINNTGSIKLPETRDLERFYKGVRLCIRKKWEAPEETTKLDDLTETLKGFITEESFTQNGMSLSISGMTKLMEQKYQFNFTQMKRSDIVKEIIKTAGLKPVVNAEGLQDDIIDYTNVTSTGSSDSSGTGDVSGATNIKSMVKQAIKGKKGDRDKAEAIYKAMVNHLVYSGYSCSKFPHTNEGADQAWQKAAVNCADSSTIGRVAYTAGGLNARVVHGPNHFWVEVSINGQWVASDVTGAEGAHCVRGLGQVYDGRTKDSVNGDWPSC